MSKEIGIGSKKIFPRATTPFEQELVYVLEDLFKEIDDALNSLEERIVALEP